MWTGCRWRSSSPPPGSTCSVSPSSTRSSSAASHCSTTGSGRSRAATLSRAWWSGATSFCTATRRRCCTSLPCTAAAPPFRHSLAAAATHGLDDAMVTYLLQALVDKSIVLVSFPDGEARYDLLDTVREYALGAARAKRWPPRRPSGARRVLRGAGRRRPHRLAGAGVAGVDEAARAGARQPLGGALLRPRHVGRSRRGPPRGGARVVLRHGRARLGGARVHGSRAGARGRFAHAAPHRAPGEPVLPRDGRGGSRGRDRDRRARSRAGGAERGALGNRPRSVGAFLRLRPRRARRAGASRSPRRRGATSRASGTDGEPGRRLSPARSAPSAEGISRPPRR